MWDVLYKIILDSLDRVLPKRRKRVRTSNPEWFTKDVLNTIIHKNVCFKKAEAMPGDKQLWRVFRLANRAANKAVQSKSNFIRTSFQNNKSDPKKFWSEINKLLGTGKGT